MLSNIKPTLRSVKAELVSLNVKFVTDAERQAKAALILVQLKTDGVIIDNPAKVKGVAKYLVNPLYVHLEIVENTEQGGNETIASDEIGPFDIETRCGACGAFNYDHVQPLLEKQNGVVHCYNCDKNYMANSHVTNCSIKNLNADFLAQAKGF